MTSVAAGAKLTGGVVFGDTLYELGGKHDNVFLVVSDCGVGSKKFIESYGDRFIDVGIAEQGCVGTAAGLALEGHVVFVLGPAQFLSMRACEQVRTAVCYQNLPVRLMSYSGGGLLSSAGSTHYGMEDIAILKSIANMTVLSIGDPQMIGELMRLSIDYPGPMYFRMAAWKKDTLLYEPGSVKYEIGKAITARKGKDITIMAHGDMMFQAMKAAEELSKEGIDIRLLDMFSIKPVDEEAILSAANETKGIVVLEDHMKYGGLASTVCDVLMDNGVMPKAFKRLGIPQTYPGFGNSDDLRNKYGYGLADTIAAVKEML